MTSPSRRNEELHRTYGPWAVVTGASSGIGAAFARHLAAAGFDLVLVARREVPMAELAVELGASCGVEVRVVPADLSDGTERASAIAATEGLDVGLFVANAGSGTSGAFLDNDLDDELAMLEVNTVAVAAMTHSFGRRLAARSGRGGIILLGSILSTQGVPRAANYAASKAYVQTLGEGLRHELRSAAVDVLLVAPGPVATGFADAADMRMGSATEPGIVAASSLAALGRRDVVRPGARSKVLGGSLALTPRRARTRILQHIMAGFTSHRSDGATVADGRSEPIGPAT